MALPKYFRTTCRDCNCSDGEARTIIDELATQFPENTLFGRERGDALAGIVSTIYQTFAGQDLYSSAEEKELMITLVMNMLAQ